MEKSKVELTKEYIDKVKKGGENAITLLISRYEKDAAKTNFILQNLGYLPQEFKGKWLFKYIQSSDHRLRMSAIKNIAKLKINNDEFSRLYQFFETEPRTDIRREIISAIGRQRDIRSKDFLIGTLEDDDPKIICQSIRALLTFRDSQDVLEQLKQLKGHKNEMVRSIIEKALFLDTQKSVGLPHTQTYNFLKNTVVHGDVRQVLKFVPEDSIHLTFTSPPYYNARDYSIYQSYTDYLEFLSEVFEEVQRVTKEGRFLLINTSPIIIPRISRQYASKRFPIPFDLHHHILNLGWEYIDDIVWVKPEASVKNRVGGFQQHRKPLAYKPNTVTEMIMVYRKKTTKLLDWNIRQYSKETVEKSKVNDGFETTNVWKIDPTFSKNHTAIFPIELCKRVIEYYSFEGDLIFDPFGGSGTLGRAAKTLNRLFFLTEKNDEYFEYMKSVKKIKLSFDALDTKFLQLEEFKKIVDDLD